MNLSISLSKFKQLLISFFQKSIHAPSVIPEAIPNQVEDRLKNKFGLFVPIVCALVVVFGLQIYSLYHAAHTSWSNFQPVFKQNYKNNPGLEEIGSRW